MAKSKDDIKCGTGQAKLSEDEAMRVGYVAGTPQETGKIADSEPVDLFSSAHNIARKQSHDTNKSSTDQSQLHRDAQSAGGAAGATTG